MSSDPVKALLALAGTASRFPSTSRYSGVETAAITTADGRTVAYLRRRFIPAAERFALLQEHVVKQGERLDQLTARFLGDPEQFWRVCDANAAMRPAELEEEGRTVRITLPEGLPGGLNG
ncbi:MAG TPA: hypothetical protein VF541_12640 [Longimicrobium sp.]